ncbi:MAG: family 20 glycosylhydrolase [Candidatus Woodwardiibium sp.]
MKRTLAVLLSLLMLFGCLPVTGFSVSDGTADGNAAAFMRIVHLDCGRKYFSAEEIKGVIDMAAENLYTHVELAFGNEGLRFLLDDMSVSVNGASYESDAVTAAVQTGNQNYTAYSSGELTESEMDEILAYAAEQGISIIPLLNSPGHMNALMDAGEALTGTTMAYDNSTRTIDVTNETATAFTLAVLAKYVAYFAEKGCTHFNLGADEYANDKYTSGAMGFGQLQSNGQYDDFIAYVNSAAAIIKEAGMTPMAFNDGIYFNNVTSSGTFDSDIAVCFWTAGWTGYTVASASTLAQQGHEIINTNDNWYYVLGNTTGYYNLSRAQTGTKETACTTVLTDSSGSVTPIGCMLCIWCDSPSVSYTTAEKENISGLLSNLAENNADYFKAPENSGDEVTLTDSATGIAVTADKLQTLTVSPVTPAPVMDGWLHSVAYDVTLTDLSGAPYTGAAEVAIPVPDGWNTAYLRAYVQESDGSYSRIGGAYADGVYTASVPHFSVVALAEIDPTANKTEQITLEVGGTQTITDPDGNYQNAPLDGLNTSIATVEVQGTTIPAGTEITVTTLTDGESYYIKSNNQYLGVQNRNTIKWFNSANDAVLWTVEKQNNDTYLLSCTYNGQSRYINRTIDWQITNKNNALPLNFSNGLFSYTYWNTHNLGSAVTFTTTPVNKTEITFTGVAAGETKVTIGNTEYTIIVSRKNVDVSLYLGGSAKSYSDTATTYTQNGSCVDVSLDNGTISFTPKSLGTATVTTASTVYSITVTEEDLSQVDPIRAEYWCTSIRLDDASGKNYMELTAEQLFGGLYIENIAPDTVGSVSATTRTDGYYFWKARVIDRGLTNGGQLSQNNSGDNETVTPAPAAYDVDALKYENGSYWFRVAGTDEWNQLNWTLHDDNNTRNTGHQLVFYYACRYINDEKAGIYTSDWGEPDYSGVVHITFELYLVEGENYAQAELLESEWDGFANGIQVITTLYDPSYEVARSEVDYSDTPGVDKIYNGQITDVPAVEAKRECTVRIYIRLKETFSVQYDWLNEPSGYNPPNGETGIESGSSYTVDTTYTSDTTVQAGVYTYTFSGWYLDSEYTQPASATLTINSDVTLYGKWTRKLDNTIIITAASNKKVYDGSELTDDSFIVTYQGKDIPRNDNGTYTINNVEVTIDATVSGSQTSVGSSTNSITVISITDNAGTVYSHTTVNGTLTVYPKIVVEYYKDSIDASNKLNMDEIGYQTNLSPEHGGALLSVGGHVTLSDEWLNEYKPNGYQDGVQQEPVPYVIGSDENKVVIRVLYQPAYTSLTIHKKGAVDLDEHQTFLFRVVGEGDDVDVTVTVHGNSSVTIDGLTVGKQYTVTEITDWSWRYGSTTVTTTLPESNWSAPAGGSGINVTLASGAAQNIVTFQNERTVPYWLDGDNFCVNVFASSTQN